MERFWNKVDKSGDCWLWTGYVTPQGYGMFRLNGLASRAHRVAYELVNGPIPEGLVVDHLCRVRHCVNPSHLEPIVFHENIIRGTQGEWAKAKTHCPSGHEYTPENTRIDERGSRQCRKCRHEQACRYREEHRALLAAKALARWRANHPNSRRYNAKGTAA
jgi:HNH endonuclease